MEIKNIKIIIEYNKIFLKSLITIINPIIVITHKKKDVLPPDKYIAIKYREKKIIIGTIFFFKSILKRKKISFTKEQLGRETGYLQMGT